MEEHGYAFSYTQYGIIDKDSRDRGFVIGGKDEVDEIRWAQIIFTSKARPLLKT